MTATEHVKHSNARYVTGEHECYQCRIAHALYQQDYRARRIAEGSMKRTVSVYLDGVDVGRMSEVEG